jgi:GMP synthase (glutamine-hydrolysing)
MIIILDYGSQYAELIARRIRECNVYSEVVAHTISATEITSKKATGLILSGGPSSVYDDGAPSCDSDIFKLGIPILGICYGMQLMVTAMGGEVTHHKKQEYGKAEILIDDQSSLLVSVNNKSVVWMSHGDSVSKLPAGFECLGHTENTPFACIASKSKQMYGVQFHPEVAHTADGMALIETFLFKICKASSDWTMSAFADKSIEEIKAKVGKDKVLLGLSGGVDSTTVAALLHKAIGDQLVCMYIDQGFMRKNESERIVELFNEHFHIPLIHVDARERFYAKTKGIEDPEKKRKAIGNEFVRVFESESHKLIGEVKYLAQGTLYPDVIESATIGTSANAVTIKTHHNVGGLPDDIKFEVIEPLRMLFKDEVRKLGLALGLPEHLVYRHPFPGPGLAIRILGELSPERVATLQEADFIVIDEIKKAGLYREVWQAFAVLLPVRSVGVMGDKRTYEETCVIRIVSSEDAMTANWVHIPYDVLDKMSSRIVNEVPGINRVTYDITSKPPSTIEWE